MLESDDRKVYLFVYALSHYAVWGVSLRRRYREVHIQYWSSLNWRDLRSGCGFVAVLVNWNLVIILPWFAIFKNIAKYLKTVLCGCYFFNFLKTSTVTFWVVRLISNLRIFQALFEQSQQFLAFKWLESMLKLQTGQISTVSKPDQSGAWAWTWSRLKFFISTIPFVSSQQYYVLPN